MAASTLNRSGLIVELAAAHTQLRGKDVETIVVTILDGIASALGRGNRVEFRDLGTFSVRRGDPRLEHNPRSGETILVGAKSVPFFKPGKELRQRVDAGKAARTDCKHDRAVKECRRVPVSDRAAAVQGAEYCWWSKSASRTPARARHSQEALADFRARRLVNDPDSFAAINRKLAAKNIKYELARIASPPSRRLWLNATAKMASMVLCGLMKGNLGLGHGNVWRPNFAEGPHRCRCGRVGSRRQTV